MFKVSKSGHYNRSGIGPSKRWLENEAVLKDIKTIFHDRFKNYGPPVAGQELLRKGYRVSRPRVARIVRANGLCARRKRKFVPTTDSNHCCPIAPNRDFTVSRRNQLRVSDITYIRTKEGWMYPTVIIDLFHRKVVGWSMGDNPGTDDTIIAAREMAVRSDLITQKLMLHSDGGSQYAGYGFADIIKKHNGLVDQRMGGKGNCWDDAVAESFFRNL